MGVPSENGGQAMRGAPLLYLGSVLRNGEEDGDGGSVG